MNTSGRLERWGVCVHDTVRCDVRQVTAHRPWSWAEHLSDAIMSTNQCLITRLHAWKLMLAVPAWHHFVLYLT